MGNPKARLSDEDRVAMFARYHAGERAADLIVAYRINKGVFDYEARKHAMRRCDLPVGHPGRRRHPPLAERDPDFVHHAGVLSEGTWRTIMARRLAGETDRALAAEFGVTQGTIVRQAREREMLKRDHPGSKRGPRGLSAMPGGFGSGKRGPGMGGRRERALREGGR